MKEQDFDIMYNDYLQQLVDIINNSGMPLTVTANVLKDLLNQVTSSLQEKLDKHQKEKE
ncbi:MAG: hypothetical protein IKN65_06535 [Clostridia bacterium]|nr:hypothetical protein [Clostridia bacterium]